MSCKYCEENNPIETKEEAKYRTYICDDKIIVCKNAKYQKPIILYCDNIKYCPMCGKKLDSNKEMALNALISNGKIYLS